MRPSDIPCSVADIHKLVEATGWQPEFDLRDTLEDMLNFWRETLKV
jgi:nucleoside-diphosphate-sugar epimerase